MAKEDARYTGSFFNSYTNTRMKLYRHCVPLDNLARSFMKNLKIVQPALFLLEIR